MEQRKDEKLESLGEAAEFESQAFIAHRNQYRLENPLPRKPDRLTGVPRMMIPFAVIALAGSMLSALRTAPVFIEIARMTVDPAFAAAEGILAMIAVDLAVVALRFILVTLQHREDRQVKITRWVSFGFWFAFGTQLIAQIYAVRGIATVLNQYVEWLELAIALAAALSGMVLAFVTGEIMAVLWMQSKAERQRITDDYELRLDDWMESMRRSWNRKKPALGVETVSFRPQLSEGVSADNADSGADKGEIVSPTVNKALTWLRENPGVMGLSVREIEKMSGINRDAVSKARRQLSENGNSNGTHSNE